MNIELYEAIKGDDREKAARMIAEVVPLAEEIVTKTYLREEFDRFETRIEAKFDRRFEAMEKRFDRAYRTALVLVAPLWAAVVAVLARPLVIT